MEAETLNEHIPEHYMQWQELKISTSKTPRTRHGHRIVLLKNNNILLYGGGNEAIFRDVYLFDIKEKKWIQPNVKGKLPPGVASFGIAAYHDSILVFGGIDDNRCVTDSLYQLDTNIWKWTKLKPQVSEGDIYPWPRLGHSFVIDDEEKFIYMFGGLSNPYFFDIAKPGTEVLNDFRILDVSSRDSVTWKTPKTIGKRPSCRESHSCVYINSSDIPRLLIYGGSNGLIKFGDLHVFDINSKTWSLIETTGIPPLPRSSHSCVYYKDRLLIFGGWSKFSDIPIYTKGSSSMSKTKANSNYNEEFACTNTLACLDLKTMNWLDCATFNKDCILPLCRSGHAVVMNKNRMYLYSGRDGYKKNRSGNQVCISDIWVLDVGFLSAPKKIVVEHCTSRYATIKWEPVENACGYLIQVFVPKNSTLSTTNIELTKKNSETPNFGIQRETDGDLLKIRKRKSSLKKHSEENLNKNSISNNSTVFDTKTMSNRSKISGDSTDSNKDIFPNKKTIIESSTIGSNYSTLHYNQINKASKPPMIPGSTKVPNMPALKVMNMQYQTELANRSRQNEAILAGEKSNQNRPVLNIGNISKMGISLEQLKKEVTFVKSENGELIAHLPYDRLKLLLGGNKMVFGSDVDAPHAKLIDNVPKTLTGNINGDQANKSLGTGSNIFGNEIIPKNLGSQLVPIKSELKSVPIGLNTKIKLCDNNSLSSPSSFMKLNDGHQHASNIISTSAPQFIRSQELAPKISHLSGITMNRNLEATFDSNQVATNQIKKLNVENLNSNRVAANQMKIPNVENSNSSHVAVNQMKKLRVENSNSSHVSVNQMKKPHVENLNSSHVAVNQIKKPHVENSNSSHVAANQMNKFHVQGLNRNQVSVEHMKKFNAEDSNSSQVYADQMKKPSERKQNNNFVFDSQIIKPQEGSQNIGGDFVYRKNESLSKKPEINKNRNTFLSASYSAYPDKSNMSLNTFANVGAENSKIMPNSDNVFEKYSSSSSNFIPSASYVRVSKDLGTHDLTYLNKSQKLNFDNSSQVIKSASNSSNSVHLSNKSRRGKKSNFDNLLKNHLENGEEGWYDVSVETSTACFISGYYIKPIIIGRNKEPILPEHEKVPLVPGINYKIRIATLNACGYDNFSDSFNFILPKQGTLNPPTKIKLLKKNEGLMIEWESADAGTEYQVYMASTQDSAPGYTYVCVYSGKVSNCFVTNSTIDTAYIDHVRNSPSVVFRIISRNSNGTSPATQVRWVQESTQ